MSHYYESYYDVYIYILINRICFKYILLVNYTHIPSK